MGGKEVQKEKTDTSDIEDRVERRLEIERQFIEQAEEQSDEEEPNRKINLELQKGSQYATVVDVEKQSTAFDSKISLTVNINGSEHTYNLPWPDDPSNPHEPVSRLCRAGGVDVDRFADLSEVPVVKNDAGTWYLCIPSSGFDPVTYEVILPTGHSKTIGAPTFDLVKSKIFFPIMFYMSRTPFAEPHPEYGLHFPDGRMVFLLLPMILIPSAIWFILTGILVIEIPLFSMVFSMIVLLVIAWQSGDVYSPSDE